jgi:glycosyltransferase involved in cell wall biosynthesis
MTATPTTPTPYHLFVTTPTFDDRVDRFWLFAEVAMRAPRCTILLKQCDDRLLAQIRAAVAHVPTVEIRVLGAAGARGIGFQRWAVRQVYSDAARAAAPALILHDLFLGWTGIPTRWRLPGTGSLGQRRVTRIVSFFFPNPSFARSIQWWGKSDYSAKERLYYAQMVSRRILTEYISCRVADYVTGNAADVTQDAQRYYGVPAANTAVIPNSIVLDGFARQPDARASLGLQDTPTLLYVGSLQKRKGIYDLLDALSLLRQTYPKVRLVLVGKVVQHEQALFDQRLTDLGLREHVVLAGFQPRSEIVRYFSAADACLILSYFEGSPRVMLEALACGCPVIASDLPGTRILDPEGEFVAFAPAGDAHGFAAAAARLLASSELRQRCSERGMARVRERFSTAAVAAQLVALYAGCLAEQRAHPASS